MTFRYVTGDLDQIDLTAPIYPNRDHTRGVALYGIDIAYLLEHKAAWQRFRYDNSPTYSFTREISASQKNSASPFIAQYDVKPTAVFANKFYDGSSLPSIYSAFSDCFFDESISPNDGGGIGSPLKKSFISSAFDIVKKKKLAIEQWPNYVAPSENILTDYIHEEQEGYPAVTPQYKTHYYHYMICNPHYDGSGSYTTSYAGNYPSFNTAETNGINYLIIGFTASYEYYLHIVTEETYRTWVKDSWCGYLKISTVNPFNFSMIPSIALAEFSRRGGYSPINYTMGSYGQERWEEQEMKFSITNPYAIKRFTTRFDF